METQKNEMAQFYKEQVQKIEREILAITNNATDIQFSDEKGAYLVALIRERKDIMDAMFVDAVKDTKHIEQVNDMLYSLSRKLYNGVITMYDKAKKTLFKDEPDADFEVKGNLRFAANEEDAVLSLPEDEYYGSNFRKIFSVIDRLHEQGYVRPDYIDSVSSKDLDNADLGANLDEKSAYESWQPAADIFKDLNLCFALHSLHAYHPYSLPDILRMNKFEVTVTIKQTI